jgi:succinate-acetate transporter protein
MFNDHLSKLYALGTTASFTGLAISHAAVNEWLQTVSLSVGIMTGLIAIFTFIAKSTRKK